MGSYRHLSREDRDEIAVFRAAGHSNVAIAGALGRSPSTISREVRRNALDSGRYSAHIADGAYMARRQRDAVLERDERLARFVRDRLTEGWSPQQISGWLRSDAEPGLRAVCMETLYAFVYASWQKGGIENANGRLRRWLPRQTNLDNLSDEDMQEIVMTYNLTPRKCLGYITPKPIVKQLGEDRWHLKAVFPHGQSEATMRFSGDFLAEAEVDSDGHTVRIERIEA